MKNYHDLIGWLRFMGKMQTTDVPERRTSMSWWNAKYTNNHGEYEITFASKDYEKAKAVEKVCCAVMDKAVKSPFDVEVVVRCVQCKFDNFCCRNVGKDGKRTKYDFCSYGERKEGADNG